VHHDDGSFVDDFVSCDGAREPGVFGNVQHPGTNICVIISRILAIPAPTKLSPHSIFRSLGDLLLTPCMVSWLLLDNGAYEHVKVLMLLSVDR